MRMTKIKRLPITENDMSAFGGSIVQELPWEQDMFDKINEIIDHINKEKKVCCKPRLMDHNCPDCWMFVAWTKHAEISKELMDKWLVDAINSKPLKESWIIIEEEKDWIDDIIEDYMDYMDNLWSVGEIIQLKETIKKYAPKVTEEELVNSWCFEELRKLLKDKWIM